MLLHYVNVYPLELSLLALWFSKTCLTVPSVFLIQYFFLLRFPKQLHLTRCEMVKINLSIRIILHRLILTLRHDRKFSCRRNSFRSLFCSLYQNLSLAVAELFLSILDKEMCLSYHVAIFLQPQIQS